MLRNKEIGNIINNNNNNVFNSNFTLNNKVNYFTLGI